MERRYRFILNTWYENVLMRLCDWVWMKKRCVNRTCVYLDGVKDGLQRGEDLCEESVPHVGEDGELLVTYGTRQVVTMETQHKHHGSKSNIPNLSHIIYINISAPLLHELLLKAVRVLVSSLNKT